MYHVVTHVKAHAMHRMQAMSTHQPGSQPRGARTARERHGEVQDLLDRYTKAITAGDGEAAAAMWALPAYVIGPDLEMAIDRPQTIAQFFGGAKEAYNAKGIESTRPEILDEEWIGDRLVVVRVRWPYLDATGREVGAERSDYTLRREPGGRLAIRCVLMRGVEGAGEAPPS
jgi:hypothetical protein